MFGRMEKWKEGSETKEKYMKNNIVDYLVRSKSEKKEK